MALHIDYANRAESGREADYVERWCAEWGIAFRSASCLVLPCLSVPLPLSNISRIGIGV